MTYSDSLPDCPSKSVVPQKGQNKGEEDPVPDQNGLERPSASCASSLRTRGGLRRGRLFRNLPSERADRSTSKSLDLHTPPPRFHSFLAHCTQTPHGPIRCAASHRIGRRSRPFHASLHAADHHDMTCCATVGRAGSTSAMCAVQAAGGLRFFRGLATCFTSDGVLFGRRFSMRPSEHRVCLTEV